MRHSPKSSFLDEEIEILVRHFGLERVRIALEKMSTGGTREQQQVPRKIASRDQKRPRPTVLDSLESIHGRNPAKYRLLSEFLRRLKEREILPESQDIRHFAQLIGLKDIDGKSRKDMLPTLLRFLLTLPTERLRIDTQRAANISAQQRQRGFSVLTDKLLGEK